MIIFVVVNMEAGTMMVVVPIVLAIVSTKSIVATFAMISSADGEFGAELSNESSTSTILAL